MDFEAIQLYNKNILRPATWEEVRNKHVLQKQKECVEDQKRRHKMYGTFQDKGVG